MDSFWIIHHLFIPKWMKANFMEKIKMIKYSFKKTEITIIDWEHLVTHSHQFSLGQLVNYWENEIQLRKWRKYRWQSERNTVDKMRKILLNVFIKRNIQSFGEEIEMLKWWSQAEAPLSLAPFYWALAHFPPQRIYFQFHFLPQNRSSK